MTEIELNRSNSILLKPGDLTQLNATSQTVPLYGSEWTFFNMGPSDLWMKADSGTTFVGDNNSKRIASGTTEVVVAVDYISVISPNQTTLSVDKDSVKNA